MWPPWELLLGYHFWTSQWNSGGDLLPRSVRAAKCFGREMLCASLTPSAFWSCRHLRVARELGKLSRTAVVLQTLYCFWTAGNLIMKDVHGSFEKVQKYRGTSITDYPKVSERGGWPGRLGPFEVRLAGFTACQSQCGANLERAVWEGWASQICSCRFWAFSSREQEGATLRNTGRYGWDG